MDIYLYNTLSRKKELFKPVKKGEVKIYNCGPTVYHYAHIGNLRAYVFADTLRRMFLVNGYNVKQVMNITDVGHLTSDADEGEDKLEKGALREGKSVKEVAEFYTAAFKNDLSLLNIAEPDVFCKATDHIAEMIEMIKVLEKKGCTYIAGGNVYFDTSKFKDYGKMACLRLDEKVNQARVEEDEYKKSPFDFVLWFTRYKYSSHEMQWPSPWGTGFPGWHIECSAMASKYLGKNFDIHTGGIDHIPVHHTNEIAQSEAAWGKQWVNYWLHNEFLIEKDGKMSKSSGEFLRLQVLIDKGFGALDYRYFLLGTHYRSPIQFSFEALAGAKNALQRARQKIAELKNEKTKAGKESKEEKELKTDFLQAINDDLNTAKALAILWGVLDDKKLDANQKLKLVEYFDSILGLNLLEEIEIEIPTEVKSLAELRLKSRLEKNWAESDRLRDEIAKFGYEILDNKDGYQIKKI